jgi:hypothetical protein
MKCRCWLIKGAAAAVRRWNHEINPSRSHYVQSSPCRPLISAYAHVLRLDTRFQIGAVSLLGDDRALGRLNCGSGTVCSISKWLLETLVSSDGLSIPHSPRLAECRTCD